MKHFDAKTWLTTHESMARIEQMGLSADAESKKEIMAEEHLVTIRHVLEQLQERCGDLELVVTPEGIARNVARCSDGKPVSFSEFAELIADIKRRFHDEIGIKHFLLLDTSEARYFDEATRGWEEVISRFGDARTDIEEASKCFALSRFAAAVFHSTQVVEIGLIAVGKFMGIADPKSGFTATYWCDLPPEFFHSF